MLIGQLPLTSRPTAVEFLEEDRNREKIDVEVWRGDKAVPGGDKPRVGRL